MAFKHNKQAWEMLFYSTPKEVETYLKNRTIAKFTNKHSVKSKSPSSLEHIYSEYLNRLPCSNSIYRKLDRGEYTDDEYLKPKTDEYGCEIIVVDEEDIIDIDEYDDFEDRHENYITEDESCYSSDEDEWTTI